MISHIDHVVLTVRDIDEAVGFYVRVLGMEAVTFARGRKALKLSLIHISEPTRPY